MTEGRHPNSGSSLDEFLDEDGVRDVVTIAAMKRVIAYQLSEAMKAQALSKTTMAAQMKTSRAQLDRILDPDDGNVTLETLAKAARAIGRTLRVELA